MIWPSPVVPGNPIFASQFNGLLTSFSSWADSVNAMLTIGGGAGTFNGPVTFASGVTFAGPVTFANATLTNATLSGATFSNAPTFSAGANFAGAAVTFANDAPATFNGAVTFAAAPTFTDAAGTRTALGLPAPSTIPTLAGANLFTNSTGLTQTISATGTGPSVQAGLTVTNDLSGFASLRSYNSLATTVLAGITLANWQVLYSNSGAGFLIQTANAAPVVFGVNNSERMRFASDGTCTFAAPTTFASSASVTMNGSFTASQPVTFSGGALSMTRPAAYLNSGVTWGLTVTNGANTDSLSIGQSGANYTVSGTLGWLGNSNTFLYFNSGQDFRIGAGTGATPIAVFKGAGRVLLGTATDDGSNLLQVNGGVNFKDATNLTFGSNWQTWTPTVTGSGSMTVSSLSVTDAQYIRIGPLVYFKLFLSFTLGGTIASGDAPSATLPVAVVGNVSTAAMQIHAPSGGWQPGYCLINSTGSVVRFANFNEAIMGAGSWLVICEGFYRAA